MQSMSVRPEQVNALAAQIRSGSQGIRSELDRLESEVGKLRAAWDGAAQQAYDQAQAKWNRSLSEMQQLLTQIAGKTEEISGQYVLPDTSAGGRGGAGPRGAGLTPRGGGPAPSAVLFGEPPDGTAGVTGSPEERRGGVDDHRNRP